MNNEPGSSAEGLFQGLSWSHLLKWRLPTGGLWRLSRAGLAGPYRLKVTVELVQLRAFPVAPRCVKWPPAFSDGLGGGCSGSCNQSQPFSVASPRPECSSPLLWTPHQTSRGCRRATSSFVLTKLFLGEMSDSFPVSVPGGQSTEKQPKLPSSIRAVRVTGAGGFCSSPRWVN